MNHQKDGEKSLENPITLILSATLSICHLWKLSSEQHSMIQHLLQRGSQKVECFQLALRASSSQLSLQTTFLGPYSLGKWE